MAKKSSVQVNITIPLEWKQSDIEMVAKARAWAVKAHAGQKDKAGKDYFKAHVTVVAEGVKGDPIAEAVAFLHDTVEDTSVTIEDIRTGFPKTVGQQLAKLPSRKSRHVSSNLTLCAICLLVRVVDEIGPENRRWETVRRFESFSKRHCPHSVRYPCR